MPSKLTLFAVPLVVALGSRLVGQCTLTWSGNPQPQLSGRAICSTLWDPDGAGPLPQRLVVGGSNLLGGSQLLGTHQPSSHGVMTWDGSVWQPLGSGLGIQGFSSVRALTVLNGDLYAGGIFSLLGGPSNVGRWDGAAWQSVGSGGPTNFTNGVAELVTWNGLLVAATNFYNGSTGTPILWTWNGTAWTMLPQGPTLGEAEHMISYAGELIVAGRVSPLTSNQSAVARWNGVSWALPILTQGWIHSLATRTSLAVGGASTLFVGGSFTGIGSTSHRYLARTNGGPTFAWSSVGNPTHWVGSIQVHNSGLTDYLVAAETGDPAAPMKRYSTATGAWTTLGTSGTPRLSALARYAGSYHGLSLTDESGACRRYDGLQWVPVNGPGIVGEVLAATRSGNDIVLGGDFPTISGVAMNGIALWNGTTFAPLGSGLSGASVDALVTLDNGDIVAGGSFSAAGGSPASNVARWNGTTWSAMGTGLSAPVHALVKMPNGDVIAGGEFAQAGGVYVGRVARWDGSAWMPMAPLDFGFFDDVLALAVSSNGALFAGGRFTIASGVACQHIARWSGAQWLSVNGGVNGDVHGIAGRPNGDMVMVGAFSQAGALTVDRCARWNGGTWFSMGAASGNAGPVRAVHVLPNGEVIAGRGFHQPNVSLDHGISRWTGSTWVAMNYLSGASSEAVDLRVIMQRADGDLIVGGHFSTAGNTMAWSLASLRSSCMPEAVPYGAGCASAAGPLTIAATTLPFVGAEYRTTTTNVAPLSLCFGVIGFSQTNLPLAQLLPEGQPGCSLLASADITMLLTNGPGTAHSSLLLANSTALIGALLYQQTVPLEFDANAALVAVRASNALTVRIGWL